MAFFWIAGTEEEIKQTVKTLKANGFTFEQGQLKKLVISFEQGQLKKLAASKQVPYLCGLYNFCGSAPLLQPRPWDAMLGEKE